MSIVVGRELTADDENWRKSHPNQQSPLNTLNSDEGGLNLGQVFNAIQRRIRIVLVINILAIGVTIAWNRTRDPVYEGSFKILIEPVTVEGQVVSAVTGNQKGGEEQDLGSAQSSSITLDYPTQIQILLSDKILHPVVEKLRLSYPRISYGTLRESLTISRIKEQSETKILEVHYRSASLAEAKQVMNLVSSAYIKYSLSERQTNVRRAINFVDSQLPKVKTQVHDLELALQTFRQKNQLIDPTTLGSQISSQMINTKQEQLTTQVELTKAKQLYRSLEQQIQLQPKGAEAASVLSEAPGYQQLVKQLQDIDVELKSLSADLTEEHPKIVSLREKRKELLPLLQQKSKDLLGSKLSQSIPNAQLLPYQNALRQDLSKQFLTVATQVKVLEAKIEKLNEATQALSIKTGQLSVISRQYENLQRQLKLTTEQLSKFLQKREELRISAARQEVPWDLIASPSVTKISSSGLVKDLALGTILGLILGTGVALLVDKMNNVIYSLKDLREELNMAILGMIPEREDERKSLKNNRATTDKEIVPPQSEEDDISTGNGSRFSPFIEFSNYYRFSPFIESFRALNSQIRLLRPDTPIRSLVISSSLPDEGKTTISIRLAQAAAAMGQRVLLVNADLRKPSLPNLVDRHNHHDFIPGLTDIIAGTFELMDTVQLFPGEENLYILPSGSVALDSTSILSSKKMQDLMKSCEYNFDLVIYDTVPLNFADSLLLIPQTDGLLMVSRLGKVHREVLRNSLRTLEVSKVSVLGLVVNMVSDSQSSAKAY